MNLSYPLGFNILGDFGNEEDAGLLACPANVRQENGFSLVLYLQVWRVFRYRFL